MAFRFTSEGYTGEENIPTIEQEKEADTRLSSPNED
jgi:hypothetical protein